MSANARPRFAICASAATITATGGAATITAAPATGGKLATFSGRAYTGAPMKPQGWELPVVIDLDGVRVPDQHRPALRQHDHEQIVGHTLTVEVSAEGIDITGVLSGEAEHVKKVVEPAKNGFKWQLSVGADPLRKEFIPAGETADVNGRTVTGPLYISRETVLGEISFVPLGADGDTSATITATAAGRKGRVMFWKNQLKAARAQQIAAAMKFSDEEIDKMDEPAAKAALKEVMKGEGLEPDGDEGKAKARAADDTDEEKKAEAATARGIQAARRAHAAEDRRVREIRASLKQYGGASLVVEIKGEDGRTQRVNLQEHAIENGMPAERAELLAMRASRADANVGGPHVYTTTTPGVTNAVIEAAILDAAGSRLFDSDFYAGSVESGAIRPRDKNKITAELAERYPDQVRQAAHKIFKGRIGLQQALTHIAATNGYRGRETISDDNLGIVAKHCMQGIEADGASTLSVTNVTANVMNKFLLEGYLYTEQAWKDVAGIRSVKDFKATKSINLFGDTEFQDLGASGELKNATLQDQAFANQVNTSGRIITIPRTTIINDDLGALGSVPKIMGRGAGLKLNKTFWTRLLDTTQLDDGGTTAFFASIHTLLNGQKGNSNYQSGGSSALSSSSLKSAKTLFDKQVDPVGNPLGVDPEILLYPPELDQTAWELLNSSFVVMQGLASTSSATLQPSDNRWKGKYKPVMSRYLSNSAYTGYSLTAWYLFANPNILPAIEVAFLNGQEMPTVQQAGPDFQFNVLGIHARAFFDMGVTVQNFRGAVKSAGA